MSETTELINGRDKSLPVFSSHRDSGLSNNTFQAALSKGKRLVAKCSDLELIILFSCVHFDL